MDPIEQFQQECRENIGKMRADAGFQALCNMWLRDSLPHRYSYNFSALGRPIIQYPQDMAAIQELIWGARPDLIIETGIAHGGSLILSASMLALLDYCDAAREGKALDPRATRRRVLGVDIDIRPHNRAAIQAHPLAHHIDMLQGSSIAPDIVSQVRAAALRHERIMVILDSNHTHAHVLAELQAYAPLTSRGSYCVVFDTAVEDMPDSQYPDRPWGKGDNPKTAVREYLRSLKASELIGIDGAPLAFEVDSTLEGKLAITVAPEGYLRRV